MSFLHDVRIDIEILPGVELRVTPFGLLCAAGVIAVGAYLASEVSEAQRAEEQHEEKLREIQREVERDARLAQVERVQAEMLRQLRQVQGKQRTRSRAA